MARRKQIENAPPKRQLGLSPAAKQARHDAFVEHYLQNGGNATQAAISAGLTVKSAHAWAWGALKNPDVQMRIAERKNEIQQKLELTTENVARHLAASLFVDARRLFKPKADGSGVELKQLHELDEDLARIVDDVYVDGDGKVSYKLPSRDKAQDKAMKHLGMYKADTAPPTPLDGIDRQLLNAMLAKLAALGRAAQ